MVYVPMNDENAKQRRYRMQMFCDRYGLGARLDDYIQEYIDGTESQLRPSDYEPARHAAAHDLAGRYAE